MEPTGCALHKHKCEWRNWDSGKCSLKWKENVIVLRYMEWRWGMLVMGKLFVMKRKYNVGKIWWRILKWNKIEDKIFMILVDVYFVDTEIVRGEVKGVNYKTYWSEHNRGTMWHDSMKW